MREYCQSCGMPLKDDVCGTEADGSKSEDYCVYCYKEGKFTSDCTMDEMIEFCIPMMVKYTDVTEDNARRIMKAQFVGLKRWK